MPMIRSLAFAALVFVGCQQAREAAPPSGVAAESSEERLVPPPAAKVTTPADAPPPTVTRSADGTVKLEGLDRWGNRIEATYESVDWLEKALPVLARGLSEQNAAELEKRVKALH